MKSMMKWLGVTAAVGALWIVTRAVVFYFVGVVAVFATAFQATVNALSKLGASRDDGAPAAPELRVQRDQRMAATLIDLTEREDTPAGALS